MRIRRILLATLLLALALALTAWGGAANSAGAPENSSKNGCTCHGMQPGALARVTLTGVPQTYTPGMTYELTLAVTAASPGVANQGGFAVSADAGAFNATDDNTQVREGMVTHTAAGNDQRSWTFDWTAPTDGNATVTFFYAGNAVNGDTVSDPADQWAKGTAAAALGGNATEPTSPAPAPTPAEQETPGLGVAGFLTAAIAATFARRRRT